MMKKPTIKTFSDHIKYFLKIFPQITKEQSDFIEDIVKWEDEKRSAFMFAKRIFEEDDDDPHK